MVVRSQRHYLAGIFSIVVVTVGVSVLWAGFPRIYHHGGERMLSGQVPPVKQWRIASAKGGFENIYRATDGDASTLVVSAGQYRNASITIDLRQIIICNLVIISHGEKESGFCRKVGVSTSMDGKRYTQRYVGNGNRYVSALWLGGPVVARYVRLTARVPGNEPWSIAEIYLR